MPAFALLAGHRAVIAAVFAVVAVCSSVHAAAPSKTKYNLDLTGTGGRVLSQEPLVVEYDAFFSREECEHFIDKVKPKLKLPGGAGTPDNARFTAALSHNEDKTVWCMTQRVADLVGVSSTQAERLRVVQYLPDTMENGPHYDARHHIRQKDMITDQNGGQRLITALWYLDDVEEGGATEFTRLGLQIASKQGKLVVFHNTYPHTIVRNPATLHHGMKVIEGDKLLVTWWFRDLPIMRYDHDSETSKFGSCDAEHAAPASAGAGRSHSAATTETTKATTIDPEESSCNSRAPVYLSEQSSFVASHAVPPLLWSAPGSGNTWARLLIEQATGVLTGSLYNDRHLARFLSGNERCMDDTVAVKAHPMHCGTKCMQDISVSTVAFRKCGPEMQGAGLNVKEFGNRAVILIREPFHAIWSDFQRSVNLNSKTDHHLMKVNRTSLLGHQFLWERFVHSFGSQHLFPSLLRERMWFRVCQCAFRCNFQRSTVNHGGDAVLHLMRCRWVKTARRQAGAYLGSLNTYRSYVEAGNEVVVVLYERLADPATRVEELTKIVSFLGSGWTAGDVACAFEDAKTTKSRRPSSHGHSEHATLRDAFPVWLACELWQKYLQYSEIQGRSLGVDLSEYGIIHGYECWDDSKPELSQGDVRSLSSIAIEAPAATMKKPNEGEGAAARSPPAPVEAPPASEPSTSRQQPVSTTTPPVESVSGLETSAAAVSTPKKKKKKRYSLDHVRLSAGAAEMRKQFQEHQNPADCSAAKYMIFKPGGSGFGSQLHIFGTQACTAMSLDRVLVPLTRLGEPAWLWNDPDFCADDPGPECYFERFTKCDECVTARECAEYLVD